MSSLDEKENVLTVEMFKNSKMLDFLKTQRNSAMDNAATLAVELETAKTIHDAQIKEYVAKIEQLVVALNAVNLEKSNMLAEIEKLKADNAELVRQKMELLVPDSNNGSETDGKKAEVTQIKTKRKSTAPLDE